MQNQLEDNENTTRDDDKAETSVSTALRSPNEYDWTESYSTADAKCFVPRCGLVFYTMAFFGVLCQVVGRFVYFHRSRG